MNFWLGLLSALLLVGVYLRFGLSRLSDRQALAFSLLVAPLLLLSPQLGIPLDPLAAAIAGASLLAGHLGWWIGRRSASAMSADRDPDPQTSQFAEPATTQAPKPEAVGPSLASVTLRLPPEQAVPPHRRASAPTQVVEARAPAPAVARPPQGIARGGVAMSDLSRTSLGRYRIDRVIGRGSMGVVYQGFDTMLGRQVAIKTMALGREFDGAELDEARQRFFREAETAGRLQHRDIVTIYDVGEEQELAYIAMEFLKGQDLQRYTGAGKLLPVPVVVRVGVRVAEALAYAHSRGVVHRDVKPANVMLHLPTGAIKVTDFGIARVTDASRTRTGTVLGTPSFMSPEHLAGQRIDGRSDLYSLAVMLYQLVAGQLPFQADSMAKLMFRIANDVAPDVRSVRPELPESLARVLARALQKNPADRHADGNQMAAELRQVDLSQPAAAWAGPAMAGAAAAPPAAEPTTDPYAATIRQQR
ncbi:serine/threonine-protein kinase [Piscinibacter sakaiensis]|uniref:serine/threonine-protein kinase n=1 Tax=Piscinibacter sakaiensis TaxID=1547922 RepID=UPI003AAA51F1